MKRTNALIAAVLAASMLTSCGGTDTAEMTSAESTVNETTAATVSETDTLSAESEETTTETSAEPAETISDTEAVEEAETAHWDTIVYDTTNTFDVTDWEGNIDYPDWYNASSTSETEHTLSEMIDNLNVPDEVTSYLYEQSATYMDWVDNDKPIRNISSGVKDFDSDGATETLYAINYLYNRKSDIIVYSEDKGVVYWSGNDTTDLSGLGNIGCYFVSDPVVECHSTSIDDDFYAEFSTWEAANMYFTDDNIFVGCDWRFDKYNWVTNYYFKLVFDNGSYHIEPVGKAGWGIHWQDTENGIYRETYVDGDIPCVLIQ